MASPSSSSRSWVYDVFPSFSGEDVRVTFLSHFLKELDRKLIIAFKDNEIERSRSLNPELEQAIMDSRIAVVVFSKNYASSSWCLNELLQIVRCKKEFGQLVIPIFYGLDPSHVRKQTEDFGKIFEKTCHNKTAKLKNQWQKALTDVANILGYHSVTWGNEAKMIEEIADDVLDKLLLTSSKDSEDLVGIEAHIAEMSLLLQLESEEVRMVGIWGTSGIGKTTIARALFHRLSRHFQSSIFIDRAFVSKSVENYSRANPDDPNMKLHLQGNFLSAILGKKDIKIDHLGALGERLKYERVLILIDDLDDNVVLDTLAGQSQWFGSGSRIIVITNDKHLLQAHEIDHIYKVDFPSWKQALQILCLSAFRKNSPPEGFEKLIVIVANLAGDLPLGLNILGSYLRGRNKEYWMDMLPRLRNGLDGKIEKTLRVSYDGLDSEEDKAIFRHIACLFNYEEVAYLKLLLADSGLSVNTALQNLADKSLIHVRQDYVEIAYVKLLLADSGLSVNIALQNLANKSHPYVKQGYVEVAYLKLLLADSGLSVNIALENLYDKSLTQFRWGTVVMHSLLQNMGTKIVRTQSIDKPGKREFLWNSKDICDVLIGKTGTSKVLGISLNIDEIDEIDGVYVHESAFKGMCNLRFLDIYSKICTPGEEVRLHLPESFDYLPPKLKILCWPKYPMRSMPSKFRPENLVKLKMQNSKLEKLWEGVSSFTCLKEMDMWGSVNLKEIPDLSMATNLEKLNLQSCGSLVELPSSIRNLNKLTKLEMNNCYNLKTLPTGMNLKSLDHLNLDGCSRLTTFPEISTNISYLILERTAIEEFPTNLRLENLVVLNMHSIKSEKLLEGVKSLTHFMTMLSPSLMGLHLSDIPTLVEVPSSFNNLNKLSKLRICYCRNLETLPTGINLESLIELDLSGCSKLRTFPNISTNIKNLFLRRTAIEEVPWWIEKFSKLKHLTMESCSKLEYVHLNISKLKHLERVIFSHCGALTGADLSGYPSGVAPMEADNIDIVAEEATSSFPDICVPEANLNFIYCFNLDLEAILHQRSVIYKSMVFSGEELPSFFTHRTTRTSSSFPQRIRRMSSSLTISLLHHPLSQPYLRFRACAVLVLVPGSRSDYSIVNIHLKCWLKDIFRNTFDSLGRPSIFTTNQRSSHLFMFDFCIPLSKDNAPLAQLNYDHVDVQLQIGDSSDSMFKLKGWGIRLLEDCSLAENQLGIPNTLPHVCEANEDNLVNQTEQGEECRCSDVETERSKKRIKLIQEEHDVTLNL